MSKSIIDIVQDFSTDFPRPQRVLELVRVVKLIEDFIEVVPDDNLSELLSSAYLELWALQELYKQAN